MSSFQSFLHVGGKRYEILYSDLDIHQKIDSLGRPASPTFGGTFNVAINMPGSGDPTLFDWMFDPAKILNGKVVLKRIDTDATLKTIKFYNAYCVGMALHFDGTANASNFRPQPAHLARTVRHQRPLPRQPLARRESHSGDGR